MPKTYKTWEVIKALTENPKLKAKDNFGFVLRVTEFNMQNFLILEDLHKIKVPFDTNVVLDETWELIQEPVDFMTALAAMEQGKNIRSEYCDKSSDVNNLKEENSWFSLKTIKGKWYIEE